MGLWEAIGNKYGRIGQVLAVATAITMIAGSVISIYGNVLQIRDSEKDEVGRMFEALNVKIEGAAATLAVWNDYDVYDMGDRDLFREVKSLRDDAGRALNAGDTEEARELIDSANDSLDDLLDQQSKRDRVEILQREPELGPQIEEAEKMVSAWIAMGDATPSERENLSLARTAHEAALSAFDGQRYNESIVLVYKAEHHLDAILGQLGKGKAAERFIRNLGDDLERLERRISELKVVLGDDENKTVDGIKLSDVGEADELYGKAVEAFNGMDYKNTSLHRDSAWRMIEAAPHHPTPTSGAPPHSEEPTPGLSAGIVVVFALLAAGALRRRNGSFRSYGT